MSSDFLFAEGSFLRGLGRVFDPFGLPEPYNWSQSPEEADARAMMADWGQAYADFAAAFVKLGPLPEPTGKQLELFTEYLHGPTKPRED
ncbi:MAG: hypothetical protein WA208_04540 [Thermoanaerobaculia bacterium]